ncbi:MAG: anaerobic ribonucleoside-triphosphate reductase activating protein [Firmicutes bacterium]|jgi:anaerobic ribonucleoside-triphosphate reductase activating protein|nr:anaerobic ribonucleoside-triphosphate reductase activating protein [Bacillota bacterium]
MEGTPIESEGQDTIRIAGVVRESIVDGPGLRFVVFCQGCPHNCLECHNPKTHDFKGGYDCDIEKIISAVEANPLLDGVTFSGGEPMCQPEAFTILAHKLKEANPTLNMVVYTGYTYEELVDMAEMQPAIKELFETIDFLIDGRFIKSQRDLTLQFRGSKNQRIIDMKKTIEQGKVILAEKYM